MSSFGFTLLRAGRSALATDLRSSFWTTDVLVVELRADAAGDGPLQLVLSQQLCNEGASDVHVRDADAALSLCKACGVVDEASLDLGRQVGGDAYGLGSNDVRPGCWRRLGGGRSGLALLGRRRRGSLRCASSSCSQLFRFRHRPAPSVSISSAAPCRSDCRLSSKATT